MALYAIERIDDAVSLTRSLLFPLDAGLWARLAVVVFFLGIGSGGGNVTSSASNAPSATSSAGPSISGTDVSLEPTAVSIPGEALAALAIVAVLVFAIWAVLAWIGATMEFVFVESLAEQSASLRRGFGRHRGRGLRLFGFRLALLVVTLALLGGAALVIFWDPITTWFAGGSPTVRGSQLFAGIAAVILFSLLVGIPALLIHGLTTEFVVPIMLREECGVLVGWRRLWSTIKAQWKQYVVYVLVAFGLRIATSLAAGIVLGIVGIVVAIPFVIVGVLLGFGAVTGGTLTTPLLVGLVLLVLAFLAVFALVGALVYVPIQSFHRYFALLFLGDVESDFDVLEEIRPPLDDEFVRSAEG